MHWHLGLMLSAYQEIPEFREALLAKSRMLLHFLRVNRLLASARLDAFVGDEPSFIIESSDLTPDGLQLFDDQHVDRWLSANDNVNKPITVRRLETGLNRVRSSRSSSEP